MRKLHDSSKRLDSKFHSLVTISKALVISVHNTFGVFPLSSLFPKRDSLWNCGVSTMCLKTNKTTVAVGFFIFCTFMHPFFSMQCKYIWGWKVQGWKVYGCRVHGWKVWSWNVLEPCKRSKLNWIVFLHWRLKLGVGQSGVEISLNRSNGPNLIELYFYVSYSSLVVNIYCVCVGRFLMDWKPADLEMIYKKVLLTFYFYK